jgi:hypothetical protein
MGVAWEVFTVNALSLNIVFLDVTPWTQIHDAKYSAKLNSIVLASYVGPGFRSC